MLRATIQTTLFALWGTTAVAGNLEAITLDPVPTPAVESRSWTGFYVGAQYSTAKWDDIFSSDSGKYNSAGIHAGYLHDFGSLVLGSELEYSTGTSSIGGSNDDLDTFSLKAMAGYDLGSFMPYAVAGAAKFSWDDDQLNSNFYGVGVAYEATDHIRLGLEYLAYDLDEADGYDRISLRASYAF
ncbi:outer membrane beta-barrel protein [Thalassobius sp. I31.1]|uniref:outer membrane protein n=1 Tax=Thalassobius sp. I31.1 TaxID=2109912 RepID=UPI000D19B547|nr:outer membrane beta-barrel protein [Thalassobius sp. I31.1]